MVNGVRKIYGVCQFLWDGTFIKEMERKLLNLVDNVR